ncbi:MAG: single-stranded DNA-binding protein [Candidatus Auribacterota bacterium]|nr:single-stranded DNA-binding protein [Candidatus Auribacterota bacterium]
MVSVNTVILAGNLTRDPEVRYTPQGSAVSNFGLAVNRTYKSRDGDKKEEVNFFDIEVWGRQAETCGEYLKKGSPVLIEGRLKQDSWENKEGQKRNKVKIRAMRVQFLPGGPGRNSRQNTDAAPAPAPYEVNFPPEPPAATGGGQSSSDEMPPF